MSIAPSLTRQMARMAHSTDITTLGPEPREKAQLCLADFLSCIFEARDLPWSQQAKALATVLPKGCTILASPLQASAMDAAFANAVMAHGLVREDMHAASNSHHGVVVWSCLLALSEIVPVTGRQLLDAAILSYEAGARLGRVLFDKELARLFRPTGLTTPIGAALGAARLLGLTEDQTVSALALAANQAGNANYLAAVEVTTSFAVIPAAIPVDVHIHINGFTSFREDMDEGLLSPSLEGHPEKTSPKKFPVRGNNP